MTEPLIIAKAGDTDLALLPALANRHGCITGATGTGKTITLQVMAEQFSRIGVPVFLADVKGDLSGISKQGQPSEKLSARLKKLGLPEPQWAACPATVWDVFGEQGHPVRATISDMGPQLIGRLLNLNDTQEGVLTMVFKIADDNGLLLLNLPDLPRCCSSSATTPRSSKRSTATCRPRASARFNVDSFSSSNRAGRASSASRCSTSTT